ncbi:DoxX family protein [Aequorivita capsosiphonis]|uniref:DoxX family protein n=1 Tax=Aequorivita capsosiphonis TaxID=487317 RepID=UPI0004207D56|nr:MauE/DoxX family redox-associated membrane protein [Aequorivita capsosiphonis]
MLPWHQYLMGVIFVLAGMNHFRKPKMYERIMPPYIPAHNTMVLVSGIAEMILGFMLLNKNTQDIAAWAIIAMMLVFLPVHIYMLQNNKAAMKLPKWALILRIPLQFAIIYWAYLYT